MNQPLISVIIPTYNEASTLPIAIQSIIDQTYSNLEIIVVDDGSTDNTEKIVKEFELRDKRVKYLKCPYIDPKRVDCRGVNISVGYKARNYAMDMSHGKWITFQDADDASMLNRIEIQYNLAEQYKATCVTTYSFRFNEKYLGKKLDIEKIIKQEKDLVVYPETLSNIAKRSRGMMMQNWFPHNKLPFFFKKRAPTCWLFMPHFTQYPGYDGSPLFKRETVDKVRFRARDERIWPAISGRGVGRDHVFQLAETFKNSYSFRLPLYLWRAEWEWPDFEEWDKYLIN